MSYFWFVKKKVLQIQRSVETIFSWRFWLKPSFCFNETIMFIIWTTQHIRWSIFLELIKEWKVICKCSIFIVKGTFNFKKLFYFNDLNDCTSSKIFLLFKSGCTPSMQGDRCCSHLHGCNKGTTSLDLLSCQFVGLGLTPVHLEILPV